MTLMAGGQRLTAVSNRRDLRAVREHDTVRMAAVVNRIQFFDPEIGERLRQ